MMRRLGLTQTVQKIHIKRPSIGKIRRFQRDARPHLVPEISAVTAIFDESIFADDPAHGVRYWAPKGSPIVTTYKGLHGRMVAYGSPLSVARTCYSGHHPRRYVSAAVWSTGHVRIRAPAAARIIVAAPGARRGLAGVST